MNDRPTPETDKQINGKPCTRFAIAAGDSLRDALVPSEFARKLERERDEARRGIRLMAQNAELWKEKAEQLEKELQVTLEEIQITNDNSYFPGKDCRCEARNESECGCDADWTPSEVYRLRAENDKLQEVIERLSDMVQQEIKKHISKVLEEIK